MRTLKQWAWIASISTLTALGLAACGSGTDTLPPKASINKVYVMGDSLADVGTFGVKFTVQNSLDAKSVQIWPQLVANAFGIDGSAQCNFYAFTGGSIAANTTAGCTNYAIGGAKIHATATDGGSTSPLNVGVQLATKASLGNYTSTDLLLIDGGGNDAADLITAYSNAATGAAGVAAYQVFLKQQLSDAVISNLLAQTNGAALAAGAYMQALANTFYTQIKTQALDKGATHVAVLNMPDVTLTPRFKTQLAALPEAQSQALQTAIRQWIGTFNSELASKFAGDARVAIVPFYEDFTDEVNNPSAYALSNVTTAACTTDKSAALGVFPCLSTELDAVSGKTAGWWKSYAFSDGFHPTPFGHQLLAASVSRALARAGWL